MVELLLLAAALSADNFAVSIGYGSSNTRISPGMTALLNLFCSAALVASAQFGKRFLQSAGPEWGTRVGAGCFFLMGTLKIFEELRKRRRKKRGKTRNKTGTSGKTAPPTGIWPAGGFDVGGWNCLRRLCRGSSGDRRTDLFCLLRGRNGGDVCRNCHRKKDGAEKRRKRSTVRRNSVLFTGVFKAHIELHVRKKNQQIPA
mgnify:FL=1